MNDDQIREWFLALADAQKQRFLAFLSYDLTLHGRYFGHYLTGEQQTRAFLGLNELQHQISQHIVALGQGRDRYPDDVLWKILEEKATAYGVAAHLKKSIEVAVNYCNSSPQ